MATPTDRKFWMLQKTPERWEVLNTVARLLYNSSVEDVGYSKLVMRALRFVAKYHQFVTKNHPDFRQ